MRQRRSARFCSLGMFLSNEQQETKHPDVISWDLPWGGKHFPVPSSPFHLLGSTGRKHCTPHCARTVCKHKNTNCLAQNLKDQPALLPFPPLTWCSRSDTESCRLCCSRWCQCPPAGLGSRSIWGSECASSAPWKRAGSGQRSFLRILHTTWRPAPHLTSGCSPCWCGCSQAPGDKGQMFET